MKRTWLRWTVLGAVLAAVFFFAILDLDRSTDILDTPGDSLLMPAMDSGVWYQGQGLPLARSLLREGTHETPHGRITVLPHVLSDLPYKNNEETAAWVDHINTTYDPDPPWTFRPERRLGHYKCMSVSASTVRDWLRLREGVALETYTSMLHGQSERGLDPKVLDSLYYQQVTEDPELFPLTGPDHYDPVTNLPVPYGMRGFVQLLIDPPDERPAADVNLPGVAYPFERDDLLPGYRVNEIFRDIVFTSPIHDVTREMSEAVRDALRQDGILYAGIRIRFSSSGGIFSDKRAGDLPIPFLTGHAVAIVGWIEQGTDLYFIYRETFGEFDRTSVRGGPAYRVYPVFGFSEIYSFRPPARSTNS